MGSKTTQPTPPKKRGARKAHNKDSDPVAVCAANDVAIDPEFAALCPPLTVEERSLLERSLNADGCRDPIDAWRDGKKLVVLDGHNRKAICDRFDIPYGVCVRDFASRDAAREWIITNQLGRRNLPEDQKGYLRGKRQQTEKKAPHRPGADKGAIVAPLKTVEKLAAEYGVSERTIYNDATYASALDTLAENCGDHVRRDLLAGTSPLSRKDAVSIARLPAEEQQAAVKTGVWKPPKQHDSKAVVFADALTTTLAVLSTIKEEYGDAGKMLATKEWKSFHIAEVNSFIGAVRGLSKRLTLLSQEVSGYAMQKKKT